MIKHFTWNKADNPNCYWIFMILTFFTSYLIFHLPKILLEFPLQSNSVLHNCYQCATNQSRGFCKSVFSFHLLRLHSDCCDVLDRQVLLPELHLFCFWRLFYKLQNPDFRPEKSDLKSAIFSSGELKRFMALVYAEISAAGTPAFLALGFSNRFSCLLFCPKTSAW